MATFYADTYGYETATASYVPKHPIPVANGQIVYISGTFTIPAALATNDLGNLAVLPQYAEMADFLYWNEDCGTTVTTSVTYVSTDLVTGLALGTAVANTAAVLLSSTLATFTGYRGTTYAIGTATTGNVLKLTFASVSTPTAGAVFRFRTGWFLP